MPNPLRPTQPEGPPFVEMLARVRAELCSDRAPYRPRWRRARLANGRSRRLGQPRRRLQARACPKDRRPRELHLPSIRIQKSLSFYFSKSKTHYAIGSLSLHERKRFEEG